jgi:hypothetical protein
MSTASLMNVARIDLQLRANDERPLGLQVTHYDETMDILGEWDPSLSFTTLYTTTDGPLAEVIFTFTKTSDSDPYRFGLLGRITSVAVTHCDHCLDNEEVGPVVILRADDKSEEDEVLKAGGTDRVCSRFTGHRPLT